MGEIIINELTSFRSYFNAVTYMPGWRQDSSDRRARFPDRAATQPNKGCVSEQKKHNFAL